MSDTVIRVENISKLYRLGEVGTGSLAHDVNRWWHKVRGKADPYLKIGEVNDRTKPAKQAVASSELLVASQNTPAEGGDRAGGASEHATGNQSPATAPQGGAPATSYSLPVTPKAAPSDWVYALKDVSFEVKRGEVLGIIGRNGAGKSTLLKILSRVTTQSEGRIKVRGRIASLLEVGTGFHPELTGRENIFLNGAILGMRKAEIARKFDEIVEFSGCARYIDTPVKRYSSGMYVRLAFAVAAHLEPEILIVDEVLAVGDAEFQKKCLGKMKDVAGHGRTILFVSHNMAAMQNLCSRAIFMNNGLVAFEGSVNGCILKYTENNSSALNNEKNLGEYIKKAFSKNTIQGSTINSINPIYPIEFIIELNSKSLLIQNPQIGIAINDLYGNRISTITSYYSESKIGSICDKVIVRCYVESLPLSEGSYNVKITLSNNNQDLEVIENAFQLSYMQADFYNNGRLPFKNHGFLMTKSKWEVLK